MTEFDTTEPPAFDEPWQAQVYGMAQVLIESGRIEPNTWAAAMRAAISKRLEAGAPDTTDSYFAAVTDALESVMSVEKRELGGVVEAWREAYETTPHGQPVKLKPVKLKTAES